MTKITRQTPPRRSQIDVYTDAKERKNNVIVLKLHSLVLDQSFWVATYHMPCVYYAPQVMTLHVVALLKFLQKLRTQGTQRTPLIFAGDFNLKPYNSGYTLLTGGTIPR